MSERHIPRAVEDYTTAFLAVMAAITFMGLWTIAAVAGTFWMLLTAAACELALRPFRR